MERPKCFKCLSDPDDLIRYVGRDGAGQRYESAPYLRAKLYLCPGCIKPRSKHERNQRFDCGCTEKRSAWVGEKHWLPPAPDCVACRGRGKISDKHGYLGIKFSAGYTDEAEREGHHYKSLWTPIAYVFPDGGWQVWKEDWKGTTGRDPGRPPNTIRDLEVMKIYFVDVANEVVKEYAEILNLNGRDFWIALNELTNILFARADRANARFMAEW